MAFHPILFTDEMIRANLEGRKTQTRRVIVGDADLIEPLGDKADSVFIHKQACPSFCDFACGGRLIKCPYGVRGDVLWARETWARGPGGSRECAYRATVKDGHHPPAWKPSIHMPKWACRLWCRIESIRVERVQDIRWHDAIAEGMKDPRRSMLRIDKNRGPVAAYAKLWDSINAKRGFGWKANPWVWAITYTPMRTGEHGWEEYCRKGAA